MYGTEALMESTAAVPCVAFHIEHPSCPDKLVRPRESSKRVLMLGFLAKGFLLLRGLGREDGIYLLPGSAVSSQVSRCNRPAYISLYKGIPTGRDSLPIPTKRRQKLDGN